MLEMEAPNLDWELLIVDNNSTDDTLQLARGLEKANPERVRVMVEKEVGLSATRNAGIRAARGRILAFLDDDAFPAKDWVSGIAEALAHPRVLCAGGPVEPLFQGELPDWMDDRFLPYLTVWDKGPEILPLTYNEYPRGANIAYRAEAFERFGPFSPHLGRKGRSLTSCEEIEHCLRIERGGGQIVYTPAARIRHWVDASRITPEWMVNRFAAQGRSEAIIHYQHAGHPGLRKGTAGLLCQHTRHRWRNLGSRPPLSTLHPRHAPRLLSGLHRRALQDPAISASTGSRATQAVATLSMTNANQAAFDLNLVSDLL